jgi:hypothetical protein
MLTKYAAALHVKFCVRKIFKNHFDECIMMLFGHFINIRANCVNLSKSKKHKIFKHKIYKKVCKK